MKKIVYVDNAATTPVSKPVLDAMLPFYTEYYGNPSSIYSVGREAKAPLEDARKRSPLVSVQKRVKSTLLPEAANRTTGQSRASPI